MLLAIIQKNRTYASFARLIDCFFKKFLLTKNKNKDNLPIHPVCAGGRIRKMNCWCLFWLLLGLYLLLVFLAAMITFVIYQCGGLSWLWFTLVTVGLAVIWIPLYWCVYAKRKNTSSRTTTDIEIITSSSASG